MSVGGVGRGGGKGRPGGVKGAGGSTGPAKSGGSQFGKVDGTGTLVGPSGLVGSGNVQGAAPSDPVTAHALDIARMLKSGEIKTREEATKRLVAEVLKEKLRMKSKALSGKIADALMDDPRLNQALERLWAKADERADP